MKANIFKPAKLKVGFNKRPDTYTGMLAFVIYYGRKNELCQEKSWERWRSKEIEAQEFANEPTSGFVLNKKVGGYKSDWNVRQTMCRIFDPRGFEFEITVANLLYILENTNSIKGKGLEGDFVYAWASGKLLLVPAGAPEYEKILAFTDMVTNKESITRKNIVLGGVYRDGKNTDWIYLGFFEAYNLYGKYDKATGTYDRISTVGKRHFFCSAEGKEFKFVSGLSQLVKAMSVDPVLNYANLMDKLERQIIYSPYDQSKDKFETLTMARLEKLFKTPEQVNTEVFFERDGIRLKGRLFKHGDNQVKLYPQHYSGQPRLSNVQRAHDTPEEDKAYSSFYSYSTYRHFTDPKVDEIRRQLKAEKLLSDSDYGSAKEVVTTVRELHEALQFQVRKQFLANGKVYKEY